MSLRDQLQHLLTRPKARRTAEPSVMLDFVERSRLVTALIFILTVAAIVFISSAGITNLNLPVLPNQLATVRISASTPFNYESAEKTKLAREQLLERVPPVYRLEFTALRQFESALRDLLAELTAYERTHPPKGPAITNRRADIAILVDACNASGPYRISTDDVLLLLTAMNAEQRTKYVETGLEALGDVYNEGVHDASFGGSAPGGVTVFQIQRPGGDIAQRPVQSLEEALTFLRINLSGDSVSREVALAVFRILRNGLKPNLVFDREASARREAEAVREVKPVIVHVARGQAIIEPGTHVSPEQYEMLMAQRKFLRENADTQRDEGLQLFGRILLVLAMVLASVFYVRLEDRETFQSNSRLGLLALVVILNLALVRAVYSLGGLDFFAQDSAWASILPYVAPSALAPLIVAILIDAGSGIFMALVISIFTGVIYGNRLDVIVVTFLASMVAIYSCREVHKRSRVVRGAGLGGLTVALFALLVGLADQLPADILFKQMGAGLVSGVFTGIVVVGLLPVFESLFKRTTDITLLELTDYNHPLLRLMQLEAPGTYHHSLVVAQLSENACNAIGANPLLARVCALFHDIGKTAKPEYFTENQRDRANPHDDANPSLSALIIKAHVMDGVDLARRHHLPRAVIDVIQQHHGTSLIRYFYQRAVNSTRSAAGTAPTSPAAPLAVAESTYRYDGPRPQFKESAVISLADGVEAASRSLRTVTPQHLGE
ncbi:MAG: HDIG domain-containing protein, partial [Opitutaceae bacterium]|nr:HDIG domain-containing protein [Opitutaceae bacterium]